MKNPFLLTLVCLMCLSVVQADEIERETARELYRLAARGDDGANAIQFATALSTLGATDAALHVARRDPNRQWISEQALRIAVERKIAFGKVDEARVLVSKIPSGDERAEALWLLAQGEIKRRNLAKARADLFASAKLLGQRAAVSPSFAVLFFQAGQGDATQRILARIEAALNKKPEMWAKFDFSWRGGEAFYRALALTGNTERALKWVEKTGSSSGVLSDFLFQRRDWKSLARIAQSLPEGDERIGYFCFAGVVAFRSGETERARELALRAETEFRRETKELALIVRERRGDFGSVIYALYAALQICGESQRAAQFFADCQAVLPSLSLKVAQVQTFFLPELLDRWGAKTEKNSKQRLEFLESWFAAVQNAQSDLLAGFDSGRFLFHQLEIIGEGFVKAGDNAKARRVAVWWQSLLPARFEMSPQIIGPYLALNVVRLYRRIGDDQAALALLRRIQPNAKNFSSLKVAEIFLLAGFVEEGRARIDPKKLTLRAYEYSASSWGDAEGSAAARQHAKIPFVTWSEKLAPAARSVALTTYATTESVPWRQKLRDFVPFPPLLFENVGFAPKFRFD